MRWSWSATRSTPTTPRPCVRASAASSTCPWPSSPTPRRRSWRPGRAGWWGSPPTERGSWRSTMLLRCSPAPPRGCSATRRGAGPPSWPLWPTTGSASPSGGGPRASTSRPRPRSASTRAAAAASRAGPGRSGGILALQLSLRVVVLVRQPTEQGEDLAEDGLADHHVLEHPPAVLGGVDELPLGAAQLVGEVRVVAEDLRVDGEQLGPTELDHLREAAAGSGVGADVGPAHRLDRRVDRPRQLRIGGEVVLGQRRAERVRHLAEELVRRPRGVVDGVDDHLQGRHRGAAHLSQGPEDPQPPEVRLVVLRAAWAGHVAGREEALAQVVLDGGHRHLGPVGEFGHQHVRSSIHGGSGQNPRKTCEISCPSEDSATILLLVRVPERGTPGGCHGGGAAHTPFGPAPPGGGGAPPTSFSLPAPQSAARGRRRGGAGR